MKLSVLRKLETLLSLVSSNIFSTTQSPKIAISVVVCRNQRKHFFLFILLLAMPFVGYSKPQAENVKKIRTVKTIKRSVLEAEFGTFRYESPITAQKSVFLG